MVCRLCTETKAIRRVLICGHRRCGDSDRHAYDRCPRTHGLGVTESTLQYSDFGSNWDVQRVCGVTARVLVCDRCHIRLSLPLTISCAAFHACV